MQQEVSPGQKALRKGRYSEPNRPYILTAVTHARKNLFNDLWSARVVINAMRFLHEQKRVDSMALVVMPDHIHWLVIPKDGNTLSSIMHALKSWTANRLTHQHGIKSPVWQSGFHDRALRKGEDIQHVARYIVANPLRGKLVENIGDYPHWYAAWL